MATTLQLFQVSRELEQAEINSFSFVQSRQNFDAKTDSKNAHIEKLGGISAFWVFMCLIGIALAIILGIWEANMAQSAILGLLLTSSMRHPNRP